MENSLPPVTIVGADVQSGAYLLRIRVSRPVEIVFGRFSGGRPLLVPAEIYIYVGSAGASRGSASLAHRLVRHTTRSAGAPHALRDPLLAAFRAHRLGPPALRPPALKRLFWHVDYMLESEAAEICNIFVLRTGRQVEAGLARQLAREPGVRALAKGLGAGDAPGATHLLRAPDSPRWWGSWVNQAGDGSAGYSGEEFE